MVELFRRDVARFLSTCPHREEHTYDVEVTTDRLPYRAAAEAIAVAARSFFGIGEASTGPEAFHR